MAGGGRAGAMPPDDDLGKDVMVKALEMSTIAQTLRAARAAMQPTLKEPSRPVTQENRQLFQTPDAGGSSSSRPTSGYSVEQLSFVRDTYGSRSDSRGSRCSRSARWPETIAEDEEGYRRDGAADVLRLDDDEDSRGPTPARPTPAGSEVGASSGSEELTPMTAAGPPGGPVPPSRVPTRPPRPPGVGLPAPGVAGLRSSGGFPEQPPPVSVADLSPHARRQLGRADSGTSMRKRASDGSPKRRKTLRSPAPPAVGAEAAGDRPASGSDAVPEGSRPQWDPSDPQGRQNVDPEGPRDLSDGEPPPGAPGAVAPTVASAPGGAPGKGVGGMGPFASSTFGSDIVAALINARPGAPVGTLLEATAQAAEAHPAPPASAASSSGNGPSASGRGGGGTPGGASPRGQQHDDDAACGTGGGSGVAGDGLPSPPPAAQGP